MNNTIKKNYQEPEIKLIKLDNEISLQLHSAPPDGPGESQNMNTPEYFNNDPYFKA